MEDSGHGFFHWNELLTTDVEAAKAFFAKTFGWSYDDTPMSDGTPYFVALKNDEPICGLMMMPPWIPAGTPPHWFNYVEVFDMEKTVATVSAAGGQVLRPPFEVPDVGRIAVIADPTGAVLGLITPALAD